MTQRMKPWGALAVVCLAGLVPSRGATVNAAPPGAAREDRQPHPPASALVSKPGTDTVRTNTPAADGDLLKFNNGDALHGTLVSLGMDGALRWRRADVKEPIAFSLDNVLELQLAARPRSAARPPHRLTLELTNGDRLAGDLVALNGSTLQLNTWYAGPLAVQRAMIRRIVFRAAPSAAVYTGPTGLADWTATKSTRNAWTFKEGAFYCAPGSSGGLGRQVDLPDAANIEFDLAWRGPLYLQLGFYCEKLTSPFGAGGGLLQFSAASVYLNRSLPARAAGIKSRSVGVAVPQLQARNKARVSVRVNKAQKTIALLLDDELVKQWTEQELAGSGRGLLFYARGQCSLRIANIVVAPWEGQLDSASDGAAAGGEDLVRLTNGDQLSGTVSRLTKDTAIVAASFGEISVPLERMARIDLAGLKAAVARRRAGDVRATFLDGSRFTLALEKLADQALVGSAESCGRVTMLLDAFSRVQFHIYEPRPEADGGDERDGAGGGDNPAGMDQPGQVEIIQIE